VAQIPMLYGLFRNALPVGSLVEFVSVHGRHNRENPTMDQREHASTEFRRTIGASPVIVRCSTDLERQAEELLDVVAKYHERGRVLHDGATVEFGGIPFTLRHVTGEVVVHEPDFKGNAVWDSVPGAEQALRILYEQEAVVKRVGAEWSSAPLHALVKMERSSVRSPRVCLYRTVPSAPRDSGWTIGAVGGDPAGPDADITMTLVGEILRVRPWLGNVLALPPGYRAVVDVHTIEAIHTEAGEHVWITDPLTLAHLSQSALKEGRLADLERAVNALLESTTTAAESLRPVRKLARRWGGGLWVAYANALTALARLKQDAATAAEVRAVVGEICRALSPGGEHEREVAPFAITENFTTLYRKYLWDEAAEVLEGLLAPGFTQQAALLFQRAVLAIDASDRVGTAEALRRSVAIEPRSAVLWFLLGAVLLEELTLEESPSVLLARPAQVVEAFDRALELLDNRDTLAVDRCVRDLDHIRLKADWTLADLLRNRTVALRETGQLDQALASANRLAAAAPDHAGSWEILGTILIALGRHEDAINAYSEAIRRSTDAPSDHPILTHDFASPWYNRAALHALLGQRAEAIVDLRQALTLAPAWADAVPFDERFQRLAADDELQRLVEEGRVAAQEHPDLRPGGRK
jgi:tetratricopeptide (TPR) repeat protein